MPQVSRFSKPGIPRCGSMPICGRRNQSSIYKQQSQTNLGPQPASLFLKFTNSRGKTAKMVRNSLFRNIVSVSGLNLKIWRPIPAKSLSPKDRGIGGGGYLLTGGSVSFALTCCRTRSAGASGPSSLNRSHPPIGAKGGSPYRCCSSCSYLIRPNGPFVWADCPRFRAFRNLGFHDCCLTPGRDDDRFHRRSSNPHSWRSVLVNNLTTNDLTTREPANDPQDLERLLVKPGNERFNGQQGLCRRIERE